MNEKEQMKLDIVKQLSLLLMEKDPHLSVEQSLSIVFNSETYQRLQRDATHLYSQSARYVYSFLLSEITTGSIR